MQAVTSEFGVDDDPGFDSYTSKVAGVILFETHLPKKVSGE